MMKAPLRTVLKNFLDHVEDVEKRKELGDDQYESEFQELKTLTEKLKEDPTYPCSHGLKDVNRPKNRYKDIVPYDFSRVILPKYEGIPGSDYINASYIKGASGAFAYIAAQGPLPNSVVDFWRMIWVCEVQVLVMACNEQEAGKFKCEAYWPQNGEIKNFGNISVELIKVSQVCPDFLVRTLLVKCESEMRDVYQFHYTSWPDHGIPDSVQPILDLVRLMRDCQASETIPILIHCSAGCGRTGTLCAVDYVWACLRHGKLDEDFSLFNIAMELRRQRIAMIQTKEQYILAHKVVATMFEQQLKVIDCHTYENLDEDGEPLVWKELKKVGTGNDVHFKKENLNNVKESIKKDAKIKDFENEVLLSKCPIQAHTSTNNSVTSYAFSPVGNCPGKNSSDSVNDVRTSESSFSRNSYLSQQSNEDNIPFIDDDDVCIRPNCGRAYLDIPSCDSISKLINCFDPFVDKVSLGTDDSSPDGDSNVFCKKMLDFQPSCTSNTHTNELMITSQVANMQVSTIEQSHNAKKISKPLNNYAVADSQLFTRTDRSALLSNRESYPPSSSRSEKLQNDLIVDLQGSKFEETCDNVKSSKKVGKATVVRRPSISKLKALFEKSGISSNKFSCDGSKRPLFRHNSHHVSRAGSAPPSLNCMDNTAAVEKESILMMVTRKFRSSSVRTEREVTSKQSGLSNGKSSTSINFKEGLSTLTRTVSFNLNKTFRSYTSSKAKTEKLPFKSPMPCPDESVVVETCKSVPETKANSTWYDKSSLPRAIAIVKPTEKLSFSSLSVGSKDDIKPDIEKCKNEDCTTKAPKLFPFLSGLNKNDVKNPSTMWYEEEKGSTNVDSEADKVISNGCNNVNMKSFVKGSGSKVLPLLPSFSQWKKIVPKSPLSSPESPKNFSDITPDPNVSISNSKFYTEVNQGNNKTNPNVTTCPVPEEIIPIADDSKGKCNFWPSNIASKNPTNDSVEVSKVSDNVCIEKDISVPKEIFVKETTVSKTENNDTRPAIPKKHVIGKNKMFVFENIVEANEANQQQKSESKNEESSVNSLSAQEVKAHDSAQDKCDLYTNVNVKAMKNIEQIENTLRKNPRAAIIDLTSRDSYSMEEELVNAVKQLSEPSAEHKAVFSNNTVCAEKSKMPVSKNVSKFPGYEVIWPEQKYSGTSCLPEQLPNSKPLLNPCFSYGEKYMKDHKSNVSSCDKTGVCYSPPLRRSVNTSLALSKSQSCGNLDWLESDDCKEQITTPTKMLVNEAVVELNTLLNQLTSKTLSEDPDFKNNNEKNISVVNEQNIKQNMAKGKAALKKNDLETLSIHSVTLVTKSHASDDSAKEEEIVFHFPPPPPIPPPPEEESPSESFNIVCKDGSLVVSEKSENIASSHEILGKVSAANVLDNDAHDVPQPAPRKSKQTNGLQRSASFSLLCPTKYKNKGYENVFIEKYQTLSRLEVNSASPKHSEQNFTKTVPKDFLSSEYEKEKAVTNYSKVNDVPCCNFLSETAIHTSEISDNLHLQSMKESNKQISTKQVSSFKQNISNENPLSSFKPVENITVSDQNHVENCSTYSKIFKFSERQLKEYNSSDLRKDSDINKKKFIPSKKSERAPLPPTPEKSVEKYPAKFDSVSVIPKKLPSRKHEKAPLPPPSLQKCSSAATVPKKGIKDFQHSMKYPPLHITDETNKLPSVHENIPNIGDDVNIKDRRNNIFKGNSVGRGLSHSQSDVSVFLSLKENKAQSNQGLKATNFKPFMNKLIKQGKDCSESSSDSDSSYEQLVLTKSDEKHADISKYSKEQKEMSSAIKSYKKEVPVAPPRSRRRNTMEVQYAKVKTKDASLILSTTQSVQDHHQKSCKTENSGAQELPPAVPLKTKGAFEVPQEFYIKEVYKKSGKPESG